MVLYQIIDRRAVGGKTRNHVRLTDDDLPVKDIIIGVVAAVDDKGEVYDHSRGIALAVGAGIRFIGRDAVVSSKCVFYVIGIRPMEYNNATAGTFHFGSDIFPSTNGMQILVLHLVGVNRDGIRQKWSVGVFRIFLAPKQQR